jgi:prepilin-type N-terminal cleavage/methylation domain-containing protein
VIRRRLSGDERGFTLVELLVSMTLGLLVLGSTMLLMDRAFRHNSEVTQHTEAQQRSRIAMEEVIRRLRSQACYDGVTPPLATGTDSSTSFYAEYGDGTTPLELVTLTYDPTAGTLTEQRITGTGTPPVFTAAPDTSLVLSNMTQEGTTPIFKYYAYPTVNPTAADQLLTTPLSAADRLKVARIEVTMQAWPNGVTAHRANSAVVHDEIHVRLADPNKSGTPRCS